MSGIIDNYRVMVAAKAVAVADQMVRVQANDGELVQDGDIHIVAPTVDVEMCEGFDANAAAIVEQKVTSR